MTVSGLFSFNRSCSQVPFVVSGSQDHTIKVWDTLELNQVEYNYIGYCITGTGKSNTV